MCVSMCVCGLGVQKCKDSRVLRDSLLLKHVIAHSICASHFFLKSLEFYLICLFDTSSKLHQSCSRLLYQ